ncbi:unnamed protein product, partial [Ectocarpus fasciculatus]
SLFCAAGLYAYDELVMCQVMQRGMRALYCGASIYVNYKFVWSPEAASEVHSRVAREIVETCKANEGLFVKFGQLLGSMQVALPPEYVGPLGELHDQAKTFDAAIVRAMLQTELGPEVLARLTDLSPEPVASASVAQVHTAYLDGKKVAVKVQKPNIAVQNKWDLFIYRLVLSGLEYSFEIPMVWSYGFVRQQLESELDFRVEAANARQCRDDILSHRELSRVAYVPETYESSERVIITEWIDGAVKITDSEQIQGMGIDASRAIRDATNLFAYQIFGSGNVHCDPHPGNLLVRVRPPDHCKDVPVVLIDHGLYVHLSDELRHDYISFWMAMMLDDEAQLVAKCKKWGIHDSELFSSMTLMRRRDKKPKAGASTAALPTATGHYENEEGQNKLKERVKNLLNDTSKFPSELGFVNRSVNYIRATNWAHGSPIDRVSIFASTAARASAGDRGRIGEW